MHQTNHQSLALSRLSVLLFMAVLAALDLGAFWTTRWFLSFTRYHFAMGPGVLWLFLLSFYVCSVPAWVVLFRLRRLLGNIQAGRVFVPDNVQALGCISRCCLAAGVICLLSAVYYLPFLMVAAPAAFMALIVHIVKNCFEEATGMKAELDYTI